VPLCTRCLSCHAQLTGAGWHACSADPHLPSTSSHIDPCLSPASFYPLPNHPSTCRCPRIMRPTTTSGWRPATRCGSTEST
jgi:hypothetical protein